MMLIFVIFCCKISKYKRCLKMNVLSVVTSTQNQTTYVLEYILSHIWAPIIVAIILAVGKFIFNDNLLYVKEIRKPTDSDINFFINLYNTRINKKYRISSEEILSYIGKNKGQDIQHHLYVCKKWNKTVGFIKFMVSKSKKYIFIAYIAIDNKDASAQKAGVNILLKKINKKFFKPKIANKIFIETEKGRGGYYSSYSRLVARYASSIKKSILIFDFDYIQPNMPDDKYNLVKEEHMALIEVPYYSPSHLTISKEQLLQIVRMIYFDIYCPSCNSITHCCEVDYSNYLEKIINAYDLQLQNVIQLNTLN